MALGTLPTQWPASAAECRHHGPEAHVPFSCDAWAWWCRSPWRWFQRPWRWAGTCPVRPCAPGIGARWRSGADRPLGRRATLEIVPLTATDPTLPDPTALSYSENADRWAWHVGNAVDCP